MESGSAIHILASRVSRQLLLCENEESYNPRFCKSCQQARSLHPSIARVPYSDCEEHYKRRVARFSKIGVRVISRSTNIGNILSS